MEPKKLQELALLIRNGRSKKNITQQELAEITGISLRSIQRMENAEVFPGSYTLKIVAEHLGILLDQAIPEITTTPKKWNLVQKRILSFSTALLLFLIAIAYIFQSVNFPETAFELSLYITGFVALYVILLMIIWR